MEAVRISDRDRELTNANRLRVAERHCGQVPSADSNDGEIGFGIAAEELCRQDATVGKRHGNLTGISDEVTIGNDQALLAIDDDG